MTIDIVIDRIEGEMAVLEVAGTTVDWPLAALPPGAVEGQRMQFAISGVEGADLAEANARLERLRARGPQGDDIEL